MTTKQSPTGFLVVLATGEYRNPLNPLYLGIDRVPAQPNPEYPTDHPEEGAAIDAYVFGRYKDPSTNLIRDYESATALLRAFSISSRDFEILLCCSGVDDPIRTFCPAEVAQTPIGFDVANIASDYWSIVQDMPASDWVSVYRAELNRAGLFPSREVAERYLQEYRERGEPDADLPFEVVFLIRVRQGC